MADEIYRGYHLREVGGFECWRFWHDDYDGARDAWEGGLDPRHGVAPTREQALTVIDALVEEFE